MADTKLSALAELAATPAVDDEVYIRDVSEAAVDESKRITTANLLATAIKKTILTTQGDIIIRGAAVPERLGIGSAGDVLTVVAGVPAWAAVAAGATLTIADTEVFNGTSPTSWTGLDLSGTVGAQVTLVILKIITASTAYVAFRKNGDTDEFYYETTTAAGCARGSVRSTAHCVFLVLTDSAGKIEWITDTAETDVIDVMAYIK